VANSRKVTNQELSEEMSKQDYLDEHGNVRQAVPSNPLEAAALDSVSFSGGGSLGMQKVQLKSYYKDAGEADLLENTWPTKEVVVKKKVSYPFKENMVEDVVERVVRVPMTEDEAAEYYANRAATMAKALNKKGCNGSDKKKKPRGKSK